MIRRDLSMWRAPEGRRRQRKAGIRALQCARFHMQGPSWARAHASNLPHGHKRAPPAGSVTLDISRFAGELAILPKILDTLDPASLKVPMRHSGPLTHLRLTCKQHLSPLSASPPPQSLDVNFYASGRFLTDGLENFVTESANGDRYHMLVLAAASGHLGVEPPGQEAVRVARLPDAASSMMAAVFNRFVNITDLRLAQVTFQTELTPSLLRMPNLRRLAITIGSTEDDYGFYEDNESLRTMLQVRCPPRLPPPLLLPRYIPSLYLIPSSRKLEIFLPDNHGNEKSRRIGCKRLCLQCL